jgi:integral membrane protein
MSVPIGAATAVDPKAEAAFKRYKIAAYVVGVGLLVLVVAMVLKWGFGMPEGVVVVGPIHGMFYMIYLALTIDFVLKARWSAKGALLIMLAGVIPFVSFVAERKVAARFASGQVL